MNKKHILPLFLILFFAGTSFAQTDSLNNVAPKEIKYRIETGYGQDFRFGKSVVTSPYHSIKGGLNIEIPLNYGFGIETGLKYNNSFGKRHQLYAHKDTATFKYNAHFVDIPVRAIYTLPLIWGLKVFAYAGPNFNIGLLHTDKISTIYHEVDPAPTHPIIMPKSGKYNTYADELHRFNFQLGTGGGLQWKNYRVRSGYNWGMNSVSKTKGKSQRIQGWQVSFEYEF